MASIAFNFSTDGSEMYMTGSGFGSAEEVTVYILGKQSNVLTCNSNGSFSGQLRAQGLASGTYSVLARGNTSGFSASANYVIS